MNQTQRQIYVGLINHFRNGVLVDLMNDDATPLSPEEETAAENVDEAIFSLLDVLDPDAQWDDVEYQEDEIGNFGRCMLSDDAARKGENGEAVDAE